MTHVPMVAALSPEDEVAQVKCRLGPMASSRTEVRWAELGPGRGPQRRRWAWPEEEKDAERSGGKEGAFPSATSPELLEDFRLAQQHLQPLEWDPDPQADERQDSESGESVGAGETDPPTPPHRGLNIPPSGGRWGSGRCFSDFLKLKSVKPII